jgi:hypothetical protein
MVKLDISPKLALELSAGVLKAGRNSQSCPALKVISIVGGNIILANTLVFGDAQVLHMQQEMTTYFYKGEGICRWPFSCSCL